MCDCHIQNRPDGFFCMSSDEMRAYGEAHNRPDIVRHADCKASHEKLDALSDEFERLCRIPIYEALPRRLQVQVWRMNLYLLTGEWHFTEPFPQEGALAAGRRILHEARSFRRHHELWNDISSIFHVILKHDYDREDLQDYEVWCHDYDDFFQADCLGWSGTFTDGASRAKQLLLRYLEAGPRETTVFIRLVSAVREVLEMLNEEPAFQWPAFQ